MQHSVGRAAGYLAVAHDDTHSDGDSDDDRDEGSFLVLRRHGAGHDDEDSALPIQPSAPRASELPTDFFHLDLPHTPPSPSLSLSLSLGSSSGPYHAVGIALEYEAEGKMSDRGCPEPAEMTAPPGTATATRATPAGPRSRGPIRQWPSSPCEMSAGDKSPIHRPDVHHDDNDHYTPLSSPPSVGDDAIIHLPVKEADRQRHGPQDCLIANRNFSFQHRDDATVPIASTSADFDSRDFALPPATTTTTAAAAAAARSEVVAIARPTSAKPQPLPPPPRPQKPAIVRTTSSGRRRLALRHPAPDLNVRSGAYVGNIAQLEATAERFSMTSSIEDAIREAHAELKRSDSQRSSILAASVRKLSLDGPKPVGAKAAVDTRQPPTHFPDSPSHAVNGGIHEPGRLSGETIGQTEEQAAAEAFAFLARHVSVRSTRSGLGELPEAVESELPMTLTGAALDEADRMMASGEDMDDDDTIRVSAHQDIDFDFEPGAEIDLDLDLTPNADTFAGHPPAQDYLQYGEQQSAYAHQAGFSGGYPQARPHADDRPPTSGSGGTYDQAQQAFGDFDGVHCDPEGGEYPGPQPLRRPARDNRPPPPRPKSYFDPSTGQQMLYYPARVPAMLNLPQKLSKTNPKAMARDQRRSQVMSAMLMDPPPKERASKLWLPDPLAGDLGPPLMEEPEGLLGESTASLLSPQSESAQGSQPSGLSPTRDEFSPLSTPSEGPQLRVPQRLTDEDRRKSRMSVLDMEAADKRKSRALEGLPPQLRASAFFDLPSSALPAVEIRDGSAMATLDSILDASASAPVSAFTDHAFAGKLGAEVYGAEKKKKRRAAADKAAADKAQLQVDKTDPPENKKRSTFLGLMGHVRKDSQPDAGERQHLSPGDVASPGLSDGGAALAPDEDEDPDEEEEDSEEEEEEDEMYTGAPTTLLAELQLRKQQQKMRTRPVHRAFPNGMHSTLLELDAVAEVERKARRGKRVNLAWEDPTMNPTPLDDDEDEDVPLGMLAVVRAAGRDADISAVAAEMNRPLGLMEKKELEENEPLSRRRDRLQGREVPAPVFAAAPAHRASMLTLTPTIAALHRLAPGPESPGKPAGDEEPEVEGETLAERAKRLKAKEEAQLPKARPVSQAFTDELLGQFGPPPEEKKPAEEEETLGQRRRRLQAEKEARTREMGTSAIARDPSTLAALTGSDRLSKRLSMADMLSAHPLESAMGAADPRKVSAPVQQQRPGRVPPRPLLNFGPQPNFPSMGGGPGVGHWAQGGSQVPTGRWAGFTNGMAHPQQAMMAPALNVGLVAQATAPGYGSVYNGMGPNGAYPTGMPGMPGMPGMGGAMNGGYGGVPRPGQQDMVERWRQSVLP
jgi:hypothetical protein